MDKIQILKFTANFVIILRDLLSYAIIARIIMSWFTMGQVSRGGRISVFLRDVTEPILRLARKIPHRIGIIDLSPFIALIALDLLGRLIVILLTKLA
jgi:uncharacterized protein YggT (Ycf19 family)